MFSWTGQLFILNTGGLVHWWGSWNVGFGPLWECQSAELLWTCTSEQHSHCGSAQTTKRPAPALSARPLMVSSYHSNWSTSRSTIWSLGVYYVG